MTQSKTASAIESTTNVTAGYLIALLTQSLVFPLFGIDANVIDHMAIAAIFTAVSLVRSYAIRRLFNRFLF